VQGRVGFDLFGGLGGGWLGELLNVPLNADYRVHWGVMWVEFKCFWERVGGQNNESTGVKFTLDGRRGKRA